MHILIAEDDAPLAGTLAEAFTAENHSPEIAGNGREALALLEAKPFDVMILDLNLPVVTGGEVLKRLRSSNNDLPVLVLTATDDVGDRVACLDAGADDYLVKPFAFSELSARLRALLRRKGRAGQIVLRVADLELDCVTRTAHRGTREIDLTPREFSLLEYFMRNVGKRITRDTIAQDVWKLAPGTMTNVVDVYVTYLRKKIDEGEQVKLIHTLRRVGYAFGPVEENDDNLHDNNLHQNLG
jgi:two-component system copper resistance phosphate regulon response regulator CusR